jgi:LysM repeat protein
MNKRICFLFTLLLVLATFSAAALPAQAQSSAPSPYDVIAAVNVLRAARGLSALQANGSLMAAAQGHSDYMSANAIISHTGAGGSSPQSRAVAAGYGGGAGVTVTENIAVAQVATAVDTIVNSIWGDSLHMSTMLSSSYTHIGVGISVAGGQAYYALKAGNVSGGQVNPPANSTPAAPGAPQAAQSTEQINYTLQTAQPEDDGSIVHEVLPGQAPWSIAIAYGIKIVDLAALNNLNPDNPIIYAGQKLIIQAASTPTITPTITETSIPATRTPSATLTERPPTRIPTITVTTTPTEKPLLPEIGLLQSFDRRTMGIGIIAVCGLGLLMIIISSLRKK